MPPSSEDAFELLDDTQISPVKLSKLIVELFDENELLDLCFELSVDYESLPALGKANKTRELIKYFQRRRRLRVLVITVRDYRPHIIPEEILADADEIIEDPTAVAANPNILKPADKENTVMIGQSIIAIIKALRTPEMRSLVVAFQTDFQAGSEQIALLNDYKNIHDLLQQLEDRYFLIYNDQRRLPADDLAWDSIMLNEPELRAKIDDLIETTTHAEFASHETRWVNQLIKVKEDLRVAAEEFELDRLKKATRLLYRILTRQPSRINAQLVATAGSLRLDTLVNALSAINDKFSTVPSSHTREMITEIENGIRALRELESRLHDLVNEHNALQELDDEIRRVEASLEHGIDELEFAWYDIQPMTADLYSDYEEEWAAGLKRTTDILDKALNDGNAVAVRRHFRRYRSQTGRRFRHVDLELLTLVQELQKVGEKLDLLLRSFK